VFFGCSNYAKSKCDFVSWDRPVPKPCPQCGAVFIVQKVLRSGTKLRCIAQGCGYTAEGEEGDAEASSQAS
jgi:DNA topoisomerase-1